MPYYPLFPNVSWTDRTIPRKIMISPYNGSAAAANSVGTTSNTSHWWIIGQAPYDLAASSTFTVYTNVFTAAATITWAEVGLYTGDINVGGSPTLTRNCWNDVSATYNSLGLKANAFTIGNAISAGTTLWFGFGCQATTTFNLTAGARDLVALVCGHSQAATRISTHASPITPGTRTTNYVAPHIGVIW